MSNTINNILDNLPVNSDITINYYDSGTFNSYYLDSPPLRTNDISNNDVVNEEINVQISRENRTETIPYQINATIDYANDLQNIDNVINLTDALNNSIANSLGNIERLNPRNISTSDMLEKTTLIVYKNIQEGEEKCHICNENYTEFDICRKNNICNHYFHHKCIDNWYTSNIKCPICQQII